MMSNHKISNMVKFTKWFITFNCRFSESGKSQAEADELLKKEVMAFLENCLFGEYKEDKIATAASYIEEDPSRIAGLGIWGMEFSEGMTEEEVEVLAPGAEWEADAR